MDFLIGVLAAMACLMFFLLGYAFRLYTWGRGVKAPEPPAPELTPEQKQKLQLETEAWQRLNSYDVADAYGLHPEASDLPRK